MSAYIPNALVSVFRDDPAEQTTDAWGQLVDDPLAFAQVFADATDLPAYLTQSVQRVADPGSGTVTVVTLYTIRLRPGAFAFAPSDRIKDQRTGDIYQVNAVSATRGMVQATDVKLICKRVT